MHATAIAMVAALASTVPAAAQSQAAAQTPVAAVSAYNDGIVSIMKQKLPFDARLERFRKLIDTYYYIPGITATVAGAKWADASESDRKAAIDAMTRHSAISLARNFTSYSGQKFTTNPDAVTRSSGAVVQTVITSASGERTELSYRLRNTPDGWKIIDVVAKGVSQLAVQRADFSATLASAGVAGMAARLRQLDDAAVAKAQ